MPCVKDFVVRSADVKGRYLVGCKTERLGAVDVVPETRVDFVGVEGAMRAVRCVWGVERIQRECWGIERKEQLKKDEDV